MRVTFRERLPAGYAAAAPNHPISSDVCWGQSKSRLKVGRCTCRPSSRVLWAIVGPGGSNREDSGRGSGPAARFEQTGAAAGGVVAKVGALGGSCQLRLAN